MNLHIRAHIGLLLHDWHFGGRRFRPLHLEDVDGPLPGVEPAVNRQVKPEAGIPKEQLERPNRPRRIGASAADFLGILDWIGGAIAARETPGDPARETLPEVACGTGPSLVRIDRGLCIDRGECGHDLTTQGNANVLKIDVVAFLTPSPSTSL